MTIVATSALAVTFAWTAAPACWRIAIAGAPGSPYDVTVGALAAARMCLGLNVGGTPGTNGALDFIRHVQAAINTAVAASGRTFTLSWGSDDKLTLAVDSGTFASSYLTDAGLLLARMLGQIAALAAATPSAAITADDQPWYLATFAAVSGGLMLPRQAGAAERDAAGRVYAFGAGATSFDWTWTAGMIPLTPEVCTAEDCATTPLLPAPAYLHAIGSTDTARRWSIVDVLHAARNAPVALIRHRWPDLRGGDTALNYYEGFLAPGDLLHETEARRNSDLHEAWASRDFTLILPGIGEAVVATRA